MSQVTIYLDPETDRRLRAAAAAAGLSVSRWIAGLIERHATTVWPTDIAALAGAWADMPDADALRHGLGSDLPRELP